MKFRLSAAAVSLTLGSSSVFGIGGAGLKVLVRSGDQAPDLGAGNIVVELRHAPAMRGRTVAFAAKRTGQETGPSPADYVVYRYEPFAGVSLAGDSDVVLPMLGPGATGVEIRMAIPDSPLDAVFDANFQNPSGPQRAIIRGNQGGFHVLAQTGVVVPNAGGKTLKSMDETLTWPLSANRTVFRGDLGFVPDPTFRSSILASNATTTHVLAAPGSTFHLPAISLTIEAVDRALLGSSSANGDALGLMLGDAETSTNVFGPFVGLVRLPEIGAALVTPIVIPGQATPPALADGTVLAWIDMAVGPNHQGALTLLVQTPTAFVEQTAMIDLAMPDPLGGAALLLAPNTPVVATASTAGLIPGGTVMAQHYDRVLFSGSRMYLPIYAQFPTFQTPVALVSAVQSRAARSAADTPLVTELRALLITQAAAPGLTGPRVQSIDTISASDDGYALAEVTLSGTGVNAGNNKAWYMCTPSDEVVLVVREGQNIEVAPGVFQVLNAVAYHSNCNTGDGLPNSLGSNGRWAFQADLNGFTSTAIIVATVASDCPADLNADGVVDDADFVIFQGAYNILDCQDPGMAAGCPSDLTGDDLVDDADFVVFLAAYNELLCP